MAASRPDPGPRTITATWRRPWSIEARRATSVAVWAAKGVPFLAPLNPQAPDEDHAITPPAGFVMVTIVLLKLACTWITPRGVLRLILRDVTRLVCRAIVLSLHRVQ
jgi:hypothetical protein